MFGDVELDKLEEELEHTKNAKNFNEPVVYAGIKVNEMEEDILKLPPGHTIFPKVDIEEFDTDMEKCLIKSRWQTIQEQRKFEDKKVQEEKGEDNTSDDKENDNASKVKGIDFRNIKPTDFKNNKRVVLPEIDDDTKEIRRNNIKSELRNI